VCTGGRKEPARSLAEAVAAAEGSVVALMLPNGSWATGVVVSACHGFILTVAHLLSERSQHTRQPPGQRSQSVSTLLGWRTDHQLSESCQPVSAQRSTVVDSHVTESGQRGIAQHECSSGHSQQKQQGEVLVQMQSPEHASDRDLNNASGGHAQLPRTAEGSKRLYWTSASLVYCFKGPLDIAVLQLDEASLRGSLHEFKLRPDGANTARQGERVAVMGFPLLSPRLGLGSCVTTGIIAKVIETLHHAENCPTAQLASPKGAQAVERLLESMMWPEEM